MHSKMNSLVSIVTPAYNCSKYIKQTIDSVIAQTYINWELLIVDDCSTDNTVNVVKDINDERVHLIINDQNCGTASCRNKALALAKGRWIAFLDSDDWWFPKKLEKQIIFMENNGFAFTYTEYTMADEYLNPKGPHVSGPTRITRKRMYDFCWPASMTVMYDANITGALKIPALKKHNDYALWLSVIRFSDCFLFPETLAICRKRPGSLSSVSKFELIRHHFLLYRIGENRSKFASILLTIRNLFWGIYKKIRFYKRVKN